MRRSFVPATLLFVGGTLLLDGTSAAEWDRSAGVSVGSYYSDNICLSENDLEGRGAATITPNLRVRGRGARADVTLDAAVSYDSLAGSNLECDNSRRARATNRESVIPSLNYSGNLELIQEWLTLESDAFVGRNPIDPLAPGGTSRFDGRDNTNITYQYGAGATLQRPIFDSAALLLRYYHNEQQNAVSLLGDSSEDRAEFDLGTERSGNRLTVGIGGRHREITVNGNNVRQGFENTLSSAEFRAALQLNSSWQFNTLIGEEWNEFLSARPDIEGSYWDVGLRWSPNERVEVALGTGERFFGSTPRMSISYRHRRSELTTDYTRSLTVPRNLRAPRLIPDDPLGPDFDQIPGDPFIVTGEPTFIGNSPVINERLSVRYRFTARRSTITLRASDSRQLRPEDLSEVQFSGLGMTFTRSLAANLSGNIRVNWNEREGQGGDDSGFFGQNSESWQAGLSVSRNIGNNTTVTMGYDYRRRESDANDPFNQFTENRLTLSAQHQF